MTEWTTRVLSFDERYTILESNDEHIVPTLSIARFGSSPPSGAVGAIVIIIGKKSGVFSKSGVILRFPPGDHQPGAVFT